MAPVGQYSSASNNTHSIRLVSLTSPYVSTMDVMDYLHPGIVKGMTQGIEAVDHEGTKCRILLDPVGFLSDYHESSNPLDTLAHGATSPCTLCNIRALNPIHESAPKWCFTHEIHSGTSASRKTTWKHIEIRKV